MAFSKTSIAALASSLLFAGYTNAQTHTSCNPLNSTCPADVALGTYTEFDFTTGVGINPNVWNSTSTPISFNTTGAQFIVSQSGDGPNMNTEFNIFFGSVSVVMRAAGGEGICSSIVLLSDDLDEIDWEILGSNRTMVESNFFGKGNTTTYDRAIYHPVDFAPQDDFHNYTTKLTSDYIEWIVDGNVVRHLDYDDPKAVFGQNFPQTPMKLYLGAWAAGDPKNAPGIVEWAQGTTDFSKGPFAMTVAHVYIQDGTNGASYTYGDTSGSWQSIKIEQGTSTIVPVLAKPLGMKATWQSISPGTRIGIIAGSSAGLVLIVAVISWCCISSARKGAREAAIAEAEWSAQQKEAELWRQKYRDERMSTNHSSTKSFTGDYNGGSHSRPPLPS